MQKKPLKDLLQELEQELLRLGYTEGSMKFYRNRWKKIIQFAVVLSMVRQPERSTLVPNA